MFHNYLAQLCTGVSRVVHLTKLVFVESKIYPFLTCSVCIITLNHSKVTSLFPTLEKRMGNELDISITNDSI